MDDFGILLTANKNTFQLVGKILIQALPIVIKSLAFIGTIALLLVEVFVHKIEWLHHIVENFPIVGEFISGLVIGIIALVIVKGFKRYLAKNNTIKIKYYQLMMTIQQIETDNLFIN
jgi:predicted DNA repair protein MutK